MSLKVIEADGRLVPAKNLQPEVFIEFDRADDDQIINEIRGGVVEEYVYEFQQGGQTVTGLSLAGVMAVAQSMGGITCGQPIWERSEEEITCDIAATDHKKGLTVWGTATEYTVMYLKSGDSRPDRFARAKALSKAQRNAIRKLIPEKMALEMIQMFRGEGRIARVQPSAQGQPSQRVQPGQTRGALPDGEKASQKQISFIYAIARELGIDDETLDDIARSRFGFKISELSRNNASQLIEQLQQQRATGGTQQTAENSNAR